MIIFLGFQILNLDLREVISADALAIRTKAKFWKLNPVASECSFSPVRPILLNFFQHKIFVSKNSQPVGRGWKSTNRLIFESKSFIYFKILTIFSFASKYSSGFGLFIAISVALSTFGAANGSCLTGSRLTFAAARTRVKTINT